RRDRRARRLARHARPHRRAPPRARLTGPRARSRRGRALVRRGRALVMTTALPRVTRALPREIVVASSYARRRAPRRTHAGWPPGRDRDPRVPPLDDATREGRDAPAD